MVRRQWIDQARPPFVDAEIDVDCPLGRAVSIRLSDSPRGFEDSAGTLSRRKHSPLP